MTQGSADDTVSAQAQATYDEIAREYYLEARHPTCASFRALSDLYVRAQLAATKKPVGPVLEVGAGMSLVAPILQERGYNLSALTLVDSSPEMLAYSKKFADAGAKALVLDATSTGLPGGSFQTIVSSLGDPYNTTTFWTEVARLLRPEGLCHFTTPAFEWSSSFRSSAVSDFAEFVRGDGATLLLPSFVLSHADQTELMMAAGLKVVNIKGMSVRDLDIPPAPKLLCVSSDTPVVTGYSVSLSPRGRSS